jgi:hypothetical protein
VKQSYIALNYCVPSTRLDVMRTWAVWCCLLSACLDSTGCERIASAQARATSHPTPPCVRPRLGRRLMGANESVSPPYTVPSNDNPTERSCGRYRYHEYSSCCADRDYLLLPSSNMSGYLPTSFTPARIATDLSNNPHLCGSITTLPSTFMYNDSSPYINIYNTKVCLRYGQP